jgi:anti-sigma factor RsiW
MSMNWLFNQCRRRRQNLCLLASGALPEMERDDLESHLAACADCRSHYEQIKSLTASLADYRDSVASLEPSQAARQTWARAMRAASQPQRTGESRPPVPTRSGWWREIFWPCRHAWGGIAALWFVMWMLNWGQPAIHDGTAPVVITQTFEEQRRLLAELIPATDREPADAPRRQPPPHSERQRPWVIG